MLLIHHDEQAWTRHTDAERQQIYGEYRQLIQQLDADGKYLAGEELKSAATAKTVRVRDGKPMVTDGPFAETREQVGGFFLIDAKDLDEATAIAGRIPSARMGTVEIRPVMEQASARPA
jgi:hypothetical protein